MSIDKFGVEFGKNYKQIDSNDIKQFDIKFHSVRKEIEKEVLRLVKNVNDNTQEIKKLKRSEENKSKEIKDIVKNTITAELSNIDKQISERVKSLIDTKAGFE